MEFTKAFFIGGNLCLDFCNTFDHTQTPPKHDFLPDRASALDWGKSAAILAAGTQDSLNPDGGTLARLREARLAIHRVISSLVRSRLPEAADLALFNARLQDVSARLELAPSGQGFAMLCREADPLSKIECEVMRSAAALLLSGETGRVRQCEGCGWLFYDKSRNRSRRWCTMGICGNQAKARRHYERVKRTKMAAA